MPNFVKNIIIFLLSATMFMISSYVDPVFIKVMTMIMGILWFALGLLYMTYDIIDVLENRKK